MTIRIGNLKPYVTLTVFKTTEASLIVKEILGKLVEICKTLTTEPILNKTTGKIVNELNTYNTSTYFAKAAWYTIESSPSWFGADSKSNEISTDEEESLKITDIHNHLIILASFKNHLILYASQEVMRNKLKELVSNGFLGFGLNKKSKSNITIAHVGELIEREEIEMAFVKGEAKNAWLEGLHAPTVLKADRKILSGPNLRFAIDSIGEQSFSYSAAISEFELDGKFRVGISHSKNTIWRGQTKVFEDFVKESKTIVNILLEDFTISDDEITKPGLPFLARPLKNNSLSMLDDGFEVTYENPVDPEKELLFGGVVDEDAEIDNWQKHGYFQVIENSNRTNNSEIICNAFYLENEIAQVCFYPVIWGDSKIELKVKVLHYYTNHKDDWRLVELDRSIFKRNKKITLRYGSGHVIQSGVLYTIQFKDVIYDNWNWISASHFDAISGFTYKKEKPEKPSGKKDKNGREYLVFDSDKLGKSDSLFCLTIKKTEDIVKNKYLNKLSDDYLILCDDGGGELADFIVIDPNPNNRYIIFIHIKKSNKLSNEIAIDKISDLTSMALKNLNSLDQGILIDNLKNRTTDNKKFWVWDAQNNASNRDNFISILEQMRENAAKHIVIFQPLIKQSSWEKSVQKFRNENFDTNVGRLKQLSSLLSSTQESAKRLGATMSVIGIQD